MELEVEAATVGTQVECSGCKSVLIVPRKEVGPGTTIGGFRIKKLLGRGGMGEVWLASQLSLERDVALKILPAQMGMNPDAAKRFLKEVRMLARLGHPNIVPAWEAGEDAGILFFAMAHVPGESLETRLQRAGAIPESEALSLVVKVGRALAYAWDRYQLLHRDIKPSNILLDANGEPQVVDLGLAKSLTDSVNLTMSGGIMGTPNYMSPEQARGDGKIDCRTDIYSLGMTLYHMVTGKVPFESPSPMETMRKQIMEPLPDPREFNPSISGPCVMLLETMLAKSPLGRHETWEIVLEDLERVAGGQSPSRILGGVGGSVLIVRGKRERATPLARGQMKGFASESSKGKRRAPLFAGIAAFVVVLLGFGWWMMDGKRVKSVKQGESPQSPSVAKALPASTNVSQEVANKGRAEYLEALEYVRGHARDFDGALARFEKAKKEVVGTVLAAKVEKEMVRLRSEKAKAVENLVANMESLVASLKVEPERAMDSGKFQEALRKLENNAMPLAAETAAVRRELVRKLKQQQAEIEHARQAAAQTGAPAKERKVEAQHSEASTTKPTTGGAPFTQGKEGPSPPVALQESTEGNVKQALAALQAANKLDTPPSYKLGPEGIVLNLGQNSHLQDLRALAGLPIVDLDVHLTDVKDLSLLVGMPLKKLNISQTKVRDLTPLSKVTTLEYLGAMQAPISDISPLRGLVRLKGLCLIWCPIQDLSPIENLNALEELDIGQTPVANLFPLHGLTHLKRLTIQHCRNVRDLSPLMGLKIEWMDMGELDVNDISPLRGMPLKTLIADNVPADDWSPLAGMSLEELCVGGKKMKSLHLFKGLSVKRLRIEGAWPEGIERLPEVLPDVQKMVFSKAPCPPSSCPEFVFRFPSLQTIQWATHGAEVFSVEAFKVKYLKKTTNER